MKYRNTRHVRNALLSRTGKEAGRNADTKRCCAREVTPKRSDPPERKFAIAEKICEKAGSERRNVIIP